MASLFISALTAEVAALEAELEQTPTYRRLQRARALLAEYSRDGNDGTGISLVEAAERVIKTIGQPPQSPPKRQRADTTQAILDAVVELLKDAREPVRTANLLTMLSERGFEIPGERALNNLSAIISYSKMFKAHGRAGWTLLDAKHANSNKEAADDPNLAGRTSTASADHRPTSGGTTSMPVEPRQGGGT